MRKYTLNENIFENIDNESKAYWLGFILADGSLQIRKSGQEVLKLSLAIIDEPHLQKFLDFIQCDMPIKKYLVGNGLNLNKSESCEITITSKKIVSDLGKLGIGPRKSFTVALPTLDDKLTRHLIRGIWDGDGSVLYRNRNSKYPNYLRPEVQICGNKLILDGINNIFEDKLSLSKSKLSPVGNIFLFRKSTNSAKKVVEFLYKDCNIALDRKLDKATLCINWSAKR